MALKVMSVNSTDLKLYLSSAYIEHIPRAHPLFVVEITASMLPQGRISYRRARLSDLEPLARIHSDIFPTRCELQSFRDAVVGHNVLSWVATDHSRGNREEDDHVLGFVSAHILPAKASEVKDFISDLVVDLIISSSSESEHSVIFIIMLGVSETCRKLGIATRLIDEVLNHASEIPTVAAVYLHVASRNVPAIELYKKLTFKCLRTLKGYYDIDGQHDDAHLFVHFVRHGKDQEASSGPTT